MSSACYHFSLIVMSEPLKATPQNDEGAPPPSNVRLSAAAHFGTGGKEDEFINILSFWCHLAHSTENTKAYYWFTIRQG